LLRPEHGLAPHRVTLGWRVNHGVGMNMHRGGLWSAALMAALSVCACSGDDDGSNESTTCTEDDPFANECDAGSAGGAASGSRAGSGASGMNGSGSSGTNGRSGSGGSTQTAGAGGNCATAMASPSRIVPNIHLVVDGSCSMELELTSQEPYGSCDIEEPGATTRWGALRNALVGDPDGVVTRLQDVIAFGHYLYGTEPTCPLIGTPIAPATGQGETIRGAFPPAPPGSNTPTGPALQMVVDGIPAVEPDSDLGPQIILLATDGAPNSCDDSTIDFQPSLQAAMAARDKGLTMYVLSLAEPSGEFAAHLQEMADIGLNQTGAPVYTPNSPEQLRQDLESLIGGAVGCDVRVNGRVDEARACEGDVRVNGEPLVCGEDWELAEASTLRLLGAACDRFRTDAAAMLTARWPCGAFVVD
jgi:hypothetical protein